MTIDDIKDIEIEKKYPCLICGKVTTGKVCSKSHQDEWVRRQSYKKLPEQEEIDTRKEIRNFNNNPDTKKHGVIAMKKKTYWTIIGFASVLLILLFLEVVWSNSILSSKEYNTSVEVTNPITVNPAETDITNNYENNNDHTINVNLDYEEISAMIADKVLGIIENETS